MKEYRVWAFARSAAPNLPALEEQLADVMREADRRGYIIVNSCIKRLLFQRVEKRLADGIVVRCAGCGKGLLYMKLF